MPPKSNILKAILFSNVLLLSACGGTSSPKQDTVTPPKFSPKLITQSPSYYPSGDINELAPTFSWHAIKGATEYNLGHENAETETEWHYYNIAPSQLSCTNIGDTCSYKPTDYNFSKNQEKVWWVQAKIGGTWKKWSQPITFTIVNGGNTQVEAPKSIAPLGYSNTTTPEFTWTSVSGATTYKLGYEDADTSEGWRQYTISPSSANCLSSQTCIYTPENTNFTLGKKISWWVKANVNGVWSDWNSTTTFTSNQAQAGRPFIIKVLSYRSGSNYVKDFKIETLGSGYNYNVDCDSDGTLEATGVTSDYTCHYDAIEQEHTISISGNYPQLKFQSSSSMLVSVEQWGSQRWRSMENMFTGGRLLNIYASDMPDLSNVTSLKGMFSGNNLKVANQIENWDVSNIRNMNSMFEMTKSFNQDIGNWDVSQVTDMGKMFKGRWHSSFNQNISNWDVGNVTNMMEMFKDQAKFEQEIGIWDVSKVTNMSGMFSNAIAFNQNISNWDVSNVTNMAEMFNNARLFNQDISVWNVSKANNMNSMFSEAKSFNQDIGNWDVSNVTNMSKMFLSAYTFDQDITSWDVSNVTDMSSMFGSAKYFNQSIGSWDVSHVTNMDSMFSFAETFNQNINDWDVSHVTSMDRMFTNALLFNQPIGQWDVGNVTNMNNMFNSAKSFNQDIANWDVSNVIEMTAMFEYTDAFNQNINNWNVSNVKKMAAMFFSAKSFDQDISNWNISRVSRMNGMFSNGVLSTQNYDKLLNRWSQLQLLHNVKFSAGNTKYSSSSLASKNLLINNFGWSITDGGPL